MAKHPFEYQAPNPSMVEDITIVRDIFKDAYDVILDTVPSGPERTLAIRKLEEASMWANKAIVGGEEGFTRC